MPAPLLDRQLKLLEYLTSSGAIFGDDQDTSPGLTLQGIDNGLLRLEACFSHEKRMEKIIAVFPRTFQMLVAAQAVIVRDFVKACPSIDITRLENARQFYEFLDAHWRREAPEPPYLRDVAACEFAFAKVRVGVNAGELEPARRDRPRRDCIRRHPDVVLLRCAYDIRPIFEGGPSDNVPVERETLLVVAIPADAEHPKVFELLRPVFDVLAVLNDWIDQSALGSTPESQELISELAEFGLVEVSR